MHWSFSIENSHKKEGRRLCYLALPKKKVNFLAYQTFSNICRNFCAMLLPRLILWSQFLNVMNFFFSIFSKMDQQYCLKWNHHQSNLLKVFSRLLGNEQFTDVLLATESKSIRCHKVVLSACSSYFEHLFLTFDEKNQIIILKDTSYDDILALVEFMYRGEINVGQVSYNKLIAWDIFFIALLHLCFQDSYIFKIIRFSKFSYLQNS